MEQVIEYCKAHWIFLSLLPGNLLMADSLVRTAAEAHGYKQTVAVLDRLANFLSFIVDVIGGFLSKKTSAQQKVD